MASEPIIGRTEQEQIERGWPFIVRRNPQPIPAAAIDAQPAACALINLEWLAHIAGAIDALNQPDAWQGTEEEIYQAQQQLEALANALSTICEMSQGAQVQFRQTECTLEFSDDGGQTWIEIYNGCKTVITYNPDTGYIEADGVPVVDGDTIINNTIIIDDTNNLSPDGLNKRCDTASYLSDLMLPSLMQEYINAKQNSANQVDVVSALVGFAVAVGGLVVTIATSGAGTPAYLAWVFTGLGIASAGSDLAAKVLLIDPGVLAAEMTPQFWQDVKCAIYCVLPSDGVLSLEVSQDIAAKLDAELLATYPNAIPLLSDSFRLFSGEALGRYSIYGALYDGSNCDLCSCGSWTDPAFKGQVLSHPAGPWVSKYITLNPGTIYDESRLVLTTENPPFRAADEIGFTIDFSRTPTFILGWSVDGRAKNDTGNYYYNREYKIEAWDENAQAWLIVEIGSTNKSNNNSFAGGQQLLANPTTKMRFTLGGWGLGDTSLEYTRFRDLRFLCAGPNVFSLEWQELGI